MSLADINKRTYEAILAINRVMFDMLGHHIDPEIWELEKAMGMHPQKNEEKGMKLYIGTKFIKLYWLHFKARPCSREEFDKLYPERVGKAGTDEPEGYLVEYPDGYQSWSPKSVFDNAYRVVTKDEVNLVSSMVEMMNA